MSASQASITVKCPHCKRTVPWTAEYPFKPFCCERCKLIDLGEWVTEEKKYRANRLSTKTTRTTRFCIDLKSRISSTAANPVYVAASINFTSYYSFKLKRR
ncbi:MAG: DNA gyrase inhibitor YacG [Gammaproteobacteria bacterium]